MEKRGSHILYRNHDLISHLAQAAPPQKNNNSGAKRIPLQAEFKL